VGIAGTGLSEEERRVFRGFPPGGVILFARNVASEDQVRALVADLTAEIPGVVLCVDQEGGSVDRFRAVTGPSPGFSRAAARGEAGHAGRLAGEVCAAFSIAWDLAPVVDRGVEGAGAKILAGRAASSEPAEVVEAAAAFLAGLSEFGVAGCLKHFPGLGRAAVDSHLDLPRIGDDPAALEMDLAPFRALAGRAPAVMISHAAMGGGRRPATLDRNVATELLRDGAGFAGVAISDDLEMGALVEFGGVPERAAAAFEAGCDLLCVGKDTAALPVSAEAIERGAPASRREEAERRIGVFRRALGRLGARRKSAPRAVAAIEAAFREACAHLA
jgi:beta-N-acetylhexosaminidase